MPKPHEHWFATIVAAFGLAVPAVGQMAATPPGQPAAQRPSGYLAPGEFDITRVIEPAPKPGDPRFDADRATFRETRKLVGTQRYAMATHDVKASAADMLGNFSCAVGVALTPDNAPKLLRLIQRATADTAGEAGRAKDLYKRDRPYLFDQGPVCQPPEELLDRRTGKPSFDYPSGHATLGWTYALVLASAAPDRAQPIMARGRAYGESRLVCGAHNLSAVQASLLATSATMALVATKPAYLADLDAAKAELDALRANEAQAPAGCAEESALVAQRVLPPFGEPEPRTGEP